MCFLLADNKNDLQVKLSREICSKVQADNVSLLNLSFKCIEGFFVHQQYITKGYNLYVHITKCCWMIAFKF